MLSSRAIPRMDSPLRSPSISPSEVGWAFWIAESQANSCGAVVVGIVAESVHYERPLTPPRPPTSWSLVSGWAAVCIGHWAVEVLAGRRRYALRVALPVGRPCFHHRPGIARPRLVATAGCASISPCCPCQPCGFRHLCPGTWDPIRGVCVLRRHTKAFIEAAGSR